MCAECKVFIQGLLSFLGPGNTFIGRPSTIVIQEKKKCIIVCDTVRYVVKCGSSNTAFLLCGFVQDNMCGEKEDGWD